MSHFNMIFTLFQWSWTEAAASPKYAYYPTNIKEVSLTEVETKEIWNTSFRNYPRKRINTEHSNYSYVTLQSLMLVTI